MFQGEGRLYFAYMSHLFFYTVFGSVILFFSNVSAQKKWDGGGNDGQWNNALNWTGNVLPLNSEDVVLDNSGVTGNYTVKLPPGAVSVSVKHISISPTGTNTIELILPAENTLVPALIIDGPGYGLDIGKGGIFRNASGASSGTPVSVADSIRIKMAVDIFTIQKGRMLQMCRSFQPLRVRKME